MGMEKELGVLNLGLQAAKSDSKPYYVVDFHPLNQ